MVRIFRGGVLDERFEGSVVVIGPKPTQMTGLVKGDLFVRDNSTCEIIGMVTGNLVSERTGKAILRGMVAKDVKSVGGDVEIHGMVIGDVVNEGGRVFIGPSCLVRGHVTGTTETAPPITGPAPTATPPASPPPTA
ncbi:MAG TPA: hypothetical protein VEM95_01505 [Thermoplasmata archaeon]|nr:hypothetical protein [Thermoplasmata archaeon]